MNENEILGAMLGAGGIDTLVYKSDLDKVAETASIQSDWREIDAQSPAYVKNRTHYTDGRTELIDTSWNGDFEAENAPDLVFDYTDGSEENIYRVYKLSDNVELSGETFNFDLENLKQKCYYSDAYTPISGIYTIYDLTVARVDDIIEGGDIPADMREEAILEFMAECDTTYEIIIDNTAIIAAYGMDETSSTVIYVLDDCDFEVFGEGEHHYTKGVYAISIVNQYEDEGEYFTNYEFIPTALETIVPLDEKYVPAETKQKINNLDLRLTAEEGKVLDISLTIDFASGNVEFYKYGTEQRLQYSNIYAAYLGNKSMRLIDPASLYFDINKKYDVQLVSINNSTQAITLSVVAVTDEKIGITEFVVNKPADEDKDDTVITGRVYQYEPNTSIIDGSNVNKLATMKDLSAGNVGYSGTQTYGNNTVGKELTELKSDIIEKLDSNQGEENEGKILGIDENGDVIPTNAPSPLPTPSSALNGKILKVKNGQWDVGDDDIGLSDDDKMFSFAIDEDSHLILSTTDATMQNYDFEIDSNGHLMMTYEEA